MKALLTLFGSLSVTSIWSKVKAALLVGAVAFMVWQGWQMGNLRHDVTTLETVQNGLLSQVAQMSVDYRVLSDNYKNTAKTSEQYDKSVTELNGKSIELEKSFSALQLKAAVASVKADKALSLQTDTTSGVSNETGSKQAQPSPVGNVGGGIGGTDAEWRKLLDDTYCSVYPTDAKCTQ
jgi:hypothetical protein